MKSLIFVISFFSVFAVANAQHANHNLTAKSYRIKTGVDQTGTLFLVHDENKIYKGYINYVFFSGKLATDKNFISRLFSNQNKKSEEIIVKYELKDSLAESLMRKLEAKGIESLIHCEDDEECRKRNFLDASHTVFDLTYGVVVKHFEYQAISLNNQHNAEKSLRKKVQDLIIVIFSMLDYKAYNKEVYSKLRPGHYYTHSNLGYIVFKKK